MATKRRFNKKLNLGTEANNADTLIGKQFNNLISWESPLIIAIAVLLLFALPGLGLMFVLHRQRKRQKFQLFSHKLQKQKNALKPKMVVVQQPLDRVQNGQNFQWRNQSPVRPESELMGTRQEESAPRFANRNQQLDRV